MNEARLLSLLSLSLYPEHRMHKRRPQAFSPSKAFAIKKCDAIKELASVLNCDLKELQGIIKFVTVPEIYTFISLIQKRLIEARKK